MPLGQAYRSSSLWYHRTWSSRIKKRTKIWSNPHPPSSFVYHIEFFLVPSGAKLGPPKRKPPLKRSSQSLQQGSCCSWSCKWGIIICSLCNLCCFWRLSLLICVVPAPQILFTAMPDSYPRIHSYQGSPSILGSRPSLEEYTMLCSGPPRGEPLPYYYYLSTSSILPFLTNALPRACINVEKKKLGVL